MYHYSLSRTLSGHPHHRGDVTQTKIRRASTAALWLHAILSFFVPRAQPGNVEVVRLLPMEV